MICVAGHQPNLYPYAGFFAKLANVDKFVIADNTQYVKKEYHNRNRVKLLNGAVTWLSIPVKNSGNFQQKINEAEIDNSQNWKRKHLKSIEVNYRKSPYLEIYLPKIKELLLQDWELLADFNIAFIRLCNEFLDIQTPLFIASELGISGNSTGFILDICKKTGADAYMHGKHAYDYVDFELLEREGITSVIQDYNAVEYKQMVGDFEPNLSILDILFNCGAESRDVIMKGHKSSRR